MIFTEAVLEPEVELSEYEIERGKPMPNIIHGNIQIRLGSMLFIPYEDKFLFSSESSLATNPPTTPDICIYALRELRLREVEARETQMPITTIEIISPSQSLDELQDKAWDIYFPAGVQSAWLVVPELKAIQLLLPNGEMHLFHDMTLTDPVTGIQIEVGKVFKGLS